jgi:DNA-binding GntR family transcriptional regulator
MSATAGVVEYEEVIELGPHTPAYLDDAARALAEKGDEEGLVDLDFRFHSQVYAECGNPFLSSHLDNLTGFSFRIWFMTNPHELAHHVLNVRMHDPIIAAVRAGDAEVLDREVTAHISQSFSTAIERMKGTSFSVATRLDLRVVT